MQITGTILKVEPPDYTDNYGNQYQNITVQTAAGPVIGRKASKTPYGVQDINKQVSWECEAKTNNRGAYNKFTKPQDPQYAQPGTPQGYQQPSQPSQAAQRPNASPQGQDRTVGMVRHGVICAMIAGNCVNYDYAIELTNFIMTGQVPIQPGASINSDDIPF